MIRISAKKDGFRRCGVAHSVQPTEFPDDRFTKKELEELKKEPLLVIEVIEEKKKTENKAEKKAEEKAEKQAEKK